MKIVKNTVAALALTGLFAGAAYAGGTGTDAPFVRAPVTPARACAPFIKHGTDAAQCQASIRFWADSYAAEVEKFAADPAGFQAYGNADKPELVPPGAGDMPNVHGEMYAGHVRGACKALRLLDKTAPLRETVIAADECLRMSYSIATLGGVEAGHIERVGVVLHDVAAALAEQKEPRPAPQP